MSQENVEVIRRGWGAWLRGDLDALVEDWDPGVIWDVSHFRDWPESNYEGVKGIQKFLAEWLDVWGDYEVTVEEILPAPDERVVTLLVHRGKGQHSGVPLELEMAQVAWFRDGKIVRFDNYEDRSEALKAAGLSE